MARIHRHQAADPPTPFAESEAALRRRKPRRALYAALAVSETERIVERMNEPLE